MGVVVGLLRGVNVGGNNKIRMEVLRALCESLGFEGPLTLIQSGNVVFRTKQRQLGPLAVRLEQAIERGHGFRPVVVLRTLEEMRGVFAQNPFAGRRDIDPGKLLVMFLAYQPAAAAYQELLAINKGPEETRLLGRELFTYYPNGMGQSKLPAALIERRLGVPGTGRNWNTVLKLLEMAEQMATGS